ncbi:MAG: sigma-54-dependent Fis family transcriptional regulator [Bdellovibrionales bacterium]|nr:sigma-54-dependent Fis family transcriptional regulator [Bdellovibrionales bacterium]
MYSPLPVVQENAHAPVLSNLNVPLIQPRRHSSFVGIISQCSRMHKIFQTLEKIASTDATALILGETGTGKELIARAVHVLSGRKGKLVPVNCGAIPEDILESELFGHEKGAFTGAVSSRVGRFQLAHGGTIFLDEIGEMSPKLQVKLLRVLQEKTVEPVGSTRSIEVDVRIIAATNKDLREEVKAGRFREDLFYRLQVIPIQLPPLRDRGGDVELLIEHFMQRVCERSGIGQASINDEALEYLKAYNWPGNVRELENTIERVVLLADDNNVTKHDLPPHIASAANVNTRMEVVEDFPEDGLNFNEMVNDFESRLITMALEKTGGNKKAAAKLLQLNRTTLVEKIKKKGLAQQIEVQHIGNADPLFS